jgi:hypothetical protein
MSAFGSLALSHDPGTAQMGMLLTISLACTLFCTLMVLPALLGPAATSHMPMEQAAWPRPTGPDLIVARPGLVPGIRADGRDKPDQDNQARRAIKDRGSRSG